MVASRGLILDPLRAAGVAPEDVTDVVFSHHHPDHTINAALFQNARYHDHWAIYENDVWTDRSVEEYPDGWALSDSVRLLATPGHTAQDISTLVRTASGLTGCTQAGRHEAGPAQDPYAQDAAQLSASRERLLALEPATVVPGHGAPFVPTEQTPR